MPPLGLASIAAYLDRCGFESDILDCFARPRDSETRIREHLLRARPRFIGFSCTTSSFLDGVRLAQVAKAVDPDIRTVFGGPHASALRETIMKRYPVIDFVVVGEGEVTMAALLAADGEAADTSRPA